MKRNRFGINLDEGIPLENKVDYEHLYVDCFSETSESLHSWIEEGNAPLLLGGQIGSGKSTLINKVLQESAHKPDIILRFDRESLNLDMGDFWGIVLAGFIDAALRQKVNLSFSILPQELGGELEGYKPDDWKALLEGLSPTPKTFSLKTFKTKVALRKRIAEVIAEVREDYIAQVIAEIGRCLQAATARPLFIFSSGIDKFNVSSAAYFSMQEIISTLMKFKTLFEVNVGHFFPKAGTSLFGADRLLLPTMKYEAVAEMLLKRMGVYAQPIRHEIDILAQWSGGNPRQAIRLLSHFEAARKGRSKDRKKRNMAENLYFAIHETTSDFFAYSPKPLAALMKTICKSARIEASLFTQPGDKDTAQLAIYGNWILINGKGDGTSWPVSVNPLIKAVFEAPSDLEETKAKLLAEYAAKFNISDISATGLGMNRIDEKTGEGKSGERLLREYLASAAEKPIPLNLAESLDILGGALLSKDRADRVIIAYKDHGVTEAARAYLFAKANSYEYQRCMHFLIEGGANRQPLQKLEEFLSEGADIISLEFSGKWEETQLAALDKQRDRFIEHQMLWWIPLADLKNYLPHWIQLRQLFEIIVLEDELLESITSEEVEADLAFFEDLSSGEQSAEANVVNNLKIVLDYLKQVRQVRQVRPEKKEVSHG